MGKIWRIMVLMLISLVKDGILKIEEVAKRVKLPEEVFAEKMKEE